MEVREERQQNPVADYVSALIAVTRPIVVGVMQSISRDRLEATSHDREILPLKLLGPLRNQGDGDCGIAFEYAVHDAVMTGEPNVMTRVADSLRKYKITRGDPASILFAIEKAGSQQLVSTRLDLITNDSSVLSGYRGRPIKLKKQLKPVGSSVSSPEHTTQLATEHPRTVEGGSLPRFYGARPLGHIREDQSVATGRRARPPYCDRSEPGRQVRLDHSG